MECEYIGAEVWMFTPEIDELNVPKCEEKCERSHLQGWSKCERSHLNQIPSDEHTHEGSFEGEMTHQNCSRPIGNMFQTLKDQIHLTHTPGIDVITG